MRPMMRFVKEYYGDKPIIGAEVGVFRGEHACEILTKLPNVAKLYLVDPYEIYPGYNPSIKDEILLGPAKAQNRLNGKRVSSDRYEWILSRFTAPLIPEPLDFIYIDGNHQYKPVKYDIQEAQKIVKHHGVIGGHDYRKNSGVAQAVNEAYGDNVETQQADWWTIHQPHKHTAPPPS